ncbi:OLC1v1007837C1 [Oldenlandia corymbosa var. corymbosa]|uniref:Reticulon-like protein n=1 Tax=Oldenlandia corymbosa var. corymbosa TaxID=529605 RepID=A0AAV1DK54_OLDCO|nr:OLC1v1007837C1 [Oldenlandia corymbosa var. corymbosa]
MRESSQYPSVHRAFGGGPVADVLMWKRWGASVALLVGSTSTWYLFERGGYNLLTFIANVLLLLVVILFFWAKSASLLNRPLPPLPDLTVSDETVTKAADVAREWINKVLLVARKIAVGGNLKLLIQVASGLWMISYIGSFFNFLTLLYIGVLLSLSMPILYEMYQDQIDSNLLLAYNVARAQYRKLDQTVLRRISGAMSKEKKTQ